MPGLTNVFACLTADEAKNTAEFWLNTGHRVMVVGPTDTVRTQDEKQDLGFWSLNDAKTIYVVVATKDDMMEMKLPD